MRTVGIVPVKDLADAKSRLAGVLAPEERAALALRTLCSVLDALALPPIAERIVVSPDDAVLREAMARGARGLRQQGRGLNNALEQARRSLSPAQADALLVVLGDLPLLAGGDIHALLTLAGQLPGAGVVLAPDRHGAGTNAVLLRPAGALPFLFGAGSLARFRDRASARQLAVHLYHAPGTALDLDTPADLAWLASHEGVRA
ncbi:MAG: 2-phospho-L-lactate guanylyltransferase [Thermomicrobiales bacterium]